MNSDISPLSIMLRTPAVRALHWILLSLTALLFSGAGSFLAVLSPSLLYGTYVLIAACVAVAALIARQQLGGFPALLYGIWLAFYCLWGTLVSPSETVVEEVARVLLRNALILAAIWIAVPDRRNLRILGTLIGIASILNCLLAVRESFDSALIKDIALALNEEATAFNTLRPAGLWSNPNEASFAYLLAFLLSAWVAAPLAWVVRGAALMGVYLATSRTGIYLLILSGFWLTITTFSERRFNGPLVVRLGATIGGLALVAFVLLPPLSDGLKDALNDTRTARFLDLFEENTRGAEQDLSRGGLAQEGLQAAFDGPWYGYGAFSFHGMDDQNAPSLTNIAAAGGVHNIYLCALGEAGFIGLLSYAFTLTQGVRRVFVRNLNSFDKATLLNLWVVYLLIGFAWHNQLTSFLGCVFAAILWQLPVALGTAPIRESPGVLKSRIPVP